MKIGKDIHRTRELKTSNRISLENLDKGKNFSDFMNEKGKQFSEQFIKKLLEDIENQGKRLSLTKNLRDLKVYKELIRKFMDEALREALSIENKTSYDRLGRTKKYKIIKEIDKKLIELTDSTLQQEKNQINILTQIDEIKGLLINLYS